MPLRKDSSLVTSGTDRLMSPRSRSRVFSHSGAGLTWLVVICLVVSTLNWYAPANPTIAERVLASATIGVALLPLYMSELGLFQIAPVFALVCMFYAIYVGVPMFVLTHYSRAWFLNERLPDSAMEFASGVSLLGVSCLLLGFYNPLSSGIGRLSPKVRFVWRDYESVSRAATSLVALGSAVMILGFKYIRFGGDETLAPGTQQIFYFASQTAYVGAGILYCQWESGQLCRGYKLLLWLVVVPVITAIGVSTGALGPALALGLLFILIRSIVRQRVPWRLFLVGISVFLVLHPIKTAFRQTFGRSGTSDDGSPIARLVFMGSLIQQEAAGKFGSVQECLGMGVDRMNFLTTFADVSTLTPAVVPFWRGHTYYPLLTKLVPRAIYLAKPLDDAVGSFSRRYGFVGRDDPTTAYKLPQLIEGYVNFGIFGVIAAMFIIGTCYRIIQDIFVVDSDCGGSIVGLAFVFVGLCDIEGNYSMQFGGVLTSIIFLYLIALWVAGWERLSVPGTPRTVNDRFREIQT